VRVFRRPLASAAPLAIAIGNFDGVHLGHQAILQATVAAARQRGLRAAVMTFDPLPREFFARGAVTHPQGLPVRLTSTREKLALFDAAGIDDVALVPFDTRFAALLPDVFVEQLIGPLKARWVMVGEDFRFGAKRAGDLDLLSHGLAQHGAELAAMPAVAVGGERVSSTRVRQALATGDLPLAAEMLGRPYSITGGVVHGDKRGRTIGFATANVALGRARRSLPPLWGVYAVKCAVQQNVGSNVSSCGAKPIIATVYGAASLGRNPAVKVNGPPSLEVHLFDFAQEIYGAKMTVEFCHKLRDEAKYESLTALTAAINADCQRAKELLGI
jgi:riboflavin kinase / FMN adenylyltransferase